MFERLKGKMFVVVSIGEDLGSICAGLAGLLVVL